MFKKLMLTFTLCCITQHSFGSEQRLISLPKPSFALLDHLASLTPRQKKIIAGTAIALATGYFCGPTIVSAIQGLRKPTNSPAKPLTVKIVDYDEKQDLDKLCYMLEPSWKEIEKYSSFSRENLQKTFKHPYWNHFGETCYDGRHFVKTIRANDSVVGLITYHMRDHRFERNDTGVKKYSAEIQWIHVAKEFRGRGYAKQLIAYANQQCKELGARWIRVENPTKQTIKMFEKLGPHLGYKIDYPCMEHSNHFITHAVSNTIDKT